MERVIIAHKLLALGKHIESMCGLAVTQGLATNP